MISSFEIVKRRYRYLAFRFLSISNFSNVPIYINNRNRYSYLKDLIEWLNENGFVNYYVIDNDSTYPPLLEYYKKELGARVIYLKKNVGHWAVWKELIYLRHPFKFYVYTDSDILPVLKKNPFLIKELFDSLKNTHFALKAGCAIKIDDLPDHYSNKEDVIKHESKLWNNKVADNIYHASVDTTFALYMPLWHGVGDWQTHIRVAGSCLIRHQPWYVDNKNLDPENEYYSKSAATSTHWTSMK